MCLCFSLPVAFLSSSTPASWFSFVFHHSIVSVVPMTGRYTKQSTKHMAVNLHVCKCCLCSNCMEGSVFLSLVIFVRIEICIDSTFNLNLLRALFEIIMRLSQQTPDGFIDSYDTCAGSLMLGDSELILLSYSDDRAFNTFVPTILTVCIRCMPFFRWQKRVRIVLSNCFMVFSLNRYGWLMFV